VLGGGRGALAATFGAALVVLVAACGGSGTDKQAARPRSTSNRVASTSGTSTTSTPPIASDKVPDGAQRLHFEVGPITVEPGQNNIAYSRGIAQPKQDGWIVGITPNLRYADGSVPPVDVIHLHHGVWVNLASHDATVPGLPERFFAVGEEKTRMVVPAGYGYQYHATTDRWLLNYMIHNLYPKPNKVWVTYDVDFIAAGSPAAKAIKPARPIWMDVENGGIYPVFDVVRGTGNNGAYTFPDDATKPYGDAAPKNEWTVDRDGVLVATAGHLHPGGLYTDMYLQRAGASAPSGHAKAGHADTAHLFRSTAHYFEPAGAVSWDVAMTGTPSDWRVAVHKGDVLSTTTTYDSKTASWYESMGIMVAWMADAAPGSDAGTDPFAKPVDVEGSLTHGHLPENDHHGGDPDPQHYEDLTKLPSQPVASGFSVTIDNFVYARGDMSIADTVPAVAQGGTLTFDNTRDAPLSNGIWHTVTACKAPCNAETGIAYPVANADVQFDSGELGNAGVPTSGKLTWQTPDDLTPGTYTYFCRIHPFMRGAFRVVKAGA
jgi:plastocyanin